MIEDYFDDSTQARLRRCGNKQELINTINDAKQSGFLVDSGLANQSLLHELWISHCGKANIPVCWARNTADGYEFYFSTHKWGIAEESLRFLSREFSQRGEESGYQIYDSGTILIRDIIPNRFQEAAARIISEIAPAQGNC